MYQQHTLKKAEVHHVLQSLDKMFLILSIGFLIAWGVDGLISANPNGFFDHIGMVTLLYLALSITNNVSKRYEHPTLKVLAFVLFGLFLAFPIGGLVGGVILGSILGYFAYKRAFYTSFITGSLAGYWLMLFLVSLFDFNPFGKLDEGLSAVFIEAFATLLNMANYNVHFSVLTWFILVPLMIGYFFSRVFEGPKPMFKPLEESVQPVVQKPKEPFKQVTAKFTKATQQEQKPEVTPTPASPPESKEETERKTPGKPTKKRTEKMEKTNKKFFQSPVPTSKVKWNQMMEKIARRLTK